MTGTLKWAPRLVLLLLSVLTALLLYDQSMRGNRWLPPCPFHLLTGLDCPGCGSARGLQSLMHGNVLAAVNHNLLLLPALFLLLVGTASSWTGKASGLWTRLNRPAIILYIVLCFWILRNLPWWPFRWLAADLS